MGRQSQTPDWTLGLGHGGFRPYLLSSIDSRNFSENGPIALAHAVSLSGDALVANEGCIGNRNVNFCCRFQHKLDILQTAVQCETNIIVKIPGPDLVHIHWHRGMLEKLLEHPADQFQFETPLLREYKCLPQ